MASERCEGKNNRITNWGMVSNCTIGNGAWVKQLDDKWDDDSWCWKWLLRKRCEGRNTLKMEFFSWQLFSLGVSFSSDKEELDDDTKGDENDGIASERCEGRNNLPPEGKRSAGSPANTSYSTILQPRYIASLWRYCSPDILRHSEDIAVQILRHSQPHCILNWKYCFSQKDIACCKCWMTKLNFCLPERFAF